MRSVSHNECHNTRRDNRQNTENTIRHEKLHVIIKSEPTRSDINGQNTVLHECQWIMVPHVTVCFTINSINRIVLFRMSVRNTNRDSHWHREYQITENNGIILLRIMSFNITTDSHIELHDRPDRNINDYYLNNENSQ